jgi:hypothetical protein
MVIVTPTTERIASCASCGKPNYRAAEPGARGVSTGYEASGTALFDLRVHNHERQTTLHFCADCLRDLSAAAFPFRSGAMEVAK